MKTLFVSHNPPENTRFFLDTSLSYDSGLQLEYEATVGDVFETDEIQLFDTQTPGSSNRSYEVVQTTSWTSSTLPNGLKISGTTSAKISGTFKTPGTYIVTLNAKTKKFGFVAPTLQQFRFVVLASKAPVLDKIVTSYKFKADKNVNFGIPLNTSSGHVTDWEWEYTNDSWMLPPGLTLDYKTGAIIGKFNGSASDPDTYDVKIIAYNNMGDDNLTVRLSFLSAPRIDTSEITINRNDEIYYSFCSNLISATIIGLPAGLYYQINDGILYIQGATTAKAGTYTIQITATNIVGTTIANFDFVVIPGRPSILDNQIINLTYHSEINQTIQLQSDEGDVLWNIDSLEIPIPEIDWFTGEVNLNNLSYESIALEHPLARALLNGINFSEGGVITGGKITGTFDPTYRSPYDYDNYYKD